MRCCDHLRLHYLNRGGWNISALICSAFSDRCVFFRCVVFRWVAAHRGWNKTRELCVVKAADGAVMGLGAKTFGWRHKCHQLFSGDFATISVVAEDPWAVLTFQLPRWFFFLCWRQFVCLKWSFQVLCGPRKTAVQLFKVAVTITGKRNLVNGGWGWKA